MTIDPSTASAEELLAALSVREVSAGDPRVVARFAIEPELEERWTALTATIEEITFAADASDTALAPPASVPDLDVMAAVREFRRGSPAVPRTWWRPFAAIALAVAALVVAWLVLRPEPNDVDQRLGTAPITLFPDREPWPNGSPLRWSPVRGADSYQIELRASSADAMRTVPDLSAPEWLPSPAMRATLPARFEWRVTATDQSNRGIVTTPWAETWQ